MAKSDVLILRLPQPSIKVSVEFYDDAEKQKLLMYPTSRQIERLVNQGCDIPTEELLTYYLFHKKRPGKPGWRDYHEISYQIDRALTKLSDFVDFTGKSIATPSDIGDQDRAITERIGESVGLSVISNIH